MRTFNGLEELKAAVGEELGSSEWHEVTQTMVDQFAEAVVEHGSGAAGSGFGDSCLQNNLVAASSP